MRSPGSQSRSLRRRGPRSFLKLQQRLETSNNYLNSRNLPAFFSNEVLTSNEPSTNTHAPDDDLCDSRSSSSVPSCLLTILHYNIRGFLSHRAELEIQIKLLPSYPLSYLFE